MTYYTYLESMDCRMIAEKPEEIVKTLEYYRDERKQKVHIPAIDRLYKTDEVKIECWRPMFSNDHWIEAEVLPGVTFSINANTFLDVMDQIAEIDTQKRGKLYKFEASPRAGYMLPESIVKAMKEYDWSKHAKQAGEMVGDLANRLAGMPNARCHNIEDQVLVCEAARKNKKK